MTDPVNEELLEFLEDLPREHRIRLACLMYSMYSKDDEYKYQKPQNPVLSIGSTTSQTPSPRNGWSAEGAKAREEGPKIAEWHKVEDDNLDEAFFGGPKVQIDDQGIAKAYDENGVRTDVPSTQEEGTKRKYDHNKVKKATRLLLEGIGDDPDRDGLKDTPERVARMYGDILNGYDLDARDFITEFDNDGNYHGPVLVQNVPFYSFCEHHLALFPGKLHIAYCPDRKIVGLSKLVRMSRVFAKRLQVQERLTKQIADAINEHLNPSWCVVKLEAEHYCMAIRGVRVPGSTTETIYGHGEYPKDIFNA